MCGGLSDGVVCWEGISPGAAASAASTSAEIPIDCLMCPSAGGRSARKKGRATRAVHLGPIYVRSMAAARPLAVLFDLDGTLIDSIELILNSAKHAFRDREGHVPSDAEWLTGVGIPLATMFRRYARDD